jgi:hypothetical protein
MNISPAQLKRLQVLYGQYEAHTLDVDGGRDARIAWASQRCRRPIHSFRDLSLDEGRMLIDALQGILGVRLPSKTPRKRMSQREATNAGTSGRHDQANEETTLAGGKDIARIQREMERLGWDQKRLDAFLASPRGPNARRTVIRTLADANRTYWALKHMKITHEYDSQQAG